MLLLLLVPSTLVCWVFAYRYLAGRRRTLRGGPPFVYAFFDSPLFAGQRANPTWLLILGIALIVAPFVTAWTFAHHDIERKIATFRNACPKMLTDEDLANIGGAQERRPDDFASPYGCRREAVNDFGHLIVNLTIEPAFTRPDFRRDRETKGARVTPIDFGANGLIAVASPTKPMDDASVGAPDRWRDARPFADVHTEKCGVSIDLHTSGNHAEANARAFAAVVNPRLDRACRYERR